MSTTTVRDWVWVHKRADELGVPAEVRWLMLMRQHAEGVGGPGGARRSRGDATAAAALLHDAGWGDERCAEIRAAHGAALAQHAEAWALVLQHRTALERRIRSLWPRGTVDLDEYRHEVYAQVVVEHPKYRADRGPWLKWAWMVARRVARTSRRAAPLVRAHSSGYVSSDTHGARELSDCGREAGRTEALADIVRIGESDSALGDHLRAHLNADFERKPGTHRGQGPVDSAYRLIRKPSATCERDVFAAARGAE